MAHPTAFGIGYLVGTVIAHVTIYGGVLALGVYASRWLTRRRDDGATISWPTKVAYALVLLLLVQQCSRPATTYVRAPPVKASGLN